MKFITENVAELSTTELLALYKKYKKERLIMAYQMRNELQDLKNLIEVRLKEVEKLEEQARYDRENCELSYNETGLWVN